MSIKHLNDHIKLKDSSNLDYHGGIRKTEVIATIPGTNIVVFKRSNKIILPGAGFTARCHFDLPRDEITPSYNKELELENSVDEVPTTDEKVYLFSVGTDGCGTDGSDVFVPNYSKWCAPSALVPFRYPTLDDDLTGYLRDQYFGRKVLSNGRVAYYFKRFEDDPIFIQKYVDGTIVSPEVYDSNKDSEIESYVEIKLKLTKDDCREFFTATTGINDARVNTISLCTAWAKNINGQTYYQDIRPLTKLNFPNEHLINLTKGLDITYHIYY